MPEIIELETLVLGALLIVSLVVVLGKRFRVHPAVGLVIAGVLLTGQAAVEIPLSSDLILSLFLPPLLFEAAFHINLTELRRNLPTVLLLAVPGVLVSMLLVGGVVQQAVGLTWPAALLFGALIAATDPISVVGIFRRLGSPKRLAVLLEGESLFNDGTAVVLFNLATAVVVTGTADWGGGLLTFVWTAGGGVLIGLGLGWLISRVIATIDDHLVETTLTTVLAFGSYLVAEQVGMSGVLAVVAAGLVNGNLGPQGMRPGTRLVVFTFWEYAAFLASSAVFLLIGLQVNLATLVEYAVPVLWAVAAVLFGRAITIYGVARLGAALPWAWRHVLWWGGLRGAVALALALSLPATLGPQREVVQVMTFGVVLFTLLVQGLSMGPLVRRLGIISRSEAQMEFERRHARALAAKASYRHMEQLHNDGLLSSHTWESIAPLLAERQRALTQAVGEVVLSDAAIESQELGTARTEALRAERASLARLQREGMISDDTFEEIGAEIDLALTAILDDLSDVALSSAPAAHLLAVVIQDRDLESALAVLTAHGLQATRIQSAGGLLRRPRHLLLVGVPEGELERAIEALGRVCRSRVEYLPSPVPGLAMPQGAPVEVSVNGATVFAFRVDRQELI
jgi:CPA1 family monovalent cation:H+ antiporter